MTVSSANLGGARVVTRQAVAPEQCRQAVTALRSRPDRHGGLEGQPDGGTVSAFASLSSSRKSSSSDPSTSGSPLVMGRRSKLLRSVMARGAPSPQAASCTTDAALSGGEPATIALARQSIAAHESCAIQALQPRSWRLNPYDLR
jgi:hypothetical protein